MKVFITNKERFDSSFISFKDGYKSSGQIHKDLYNQVIRHMADGFIPMCVLCDYSNDGVAVFDFVSKKGDILFYEFATTVS